MADGLAAAWRRSESDSPWSNLSGKLRKGPYGPNFPIPFFWAIAIANYRLNCPLPIANELQKIRTCGDHLEAFPNFEIFFGVAVDSGADLRLETESGWDFDIGYWQDEQLIVHLSLWSWGNHNAQIENSGYFLSRRDSDCVTACQPSAMSHFQHCHCPYHLPWYFVCSCGTDCVMC